MGALRTWLRSDRSRWAAGVAFAALTVAAACATPARAAAPDSALLERFGRVPLHLEQNEGQWDPAVRFLARGPGYVLFLTAEGPTLKLLPAVAGGKRAPVGASVLRLRLAGSSRAERIEPALARGGVSHYYLGADASQWRTHSRHVDTVTYTRVYPGIDVAYHGNQRQLEYDFIVSPGADPGLIRLRFEGARGLRIDARGDLVVATAAGPLVQRAPVAYQEADGQRTQVPVTFALHGREARFRLAAYDRTRPLVIDPVLVYSTYLGGNDRPPGSPAVLAEKATSVAVATDGSLYVAGVTGSTDFPKANAFQPAYGGGDGDAFVSRFSAAGDTLLFSTFLGGADYDAAYGLALDPAGNVYVAGFTHSTNFPILNAYQSTEQGITDAFVTKLSPAGLLQYSTYLGGAEGGDYASDIAVNPAGEATVVGNTDSSDFPTTPGAFQTSEEVFVARLAADGLSLLASTCLGGSSSDSATAVAVDATGSTYVAGYTYSQDFPTLNPYQTNPDSFGQDAFVTKLNPAFTGLVYSTYLGGNSTDGAHGIAVDGDGHAYVAGTTSSSDFPQVNPLPPAPTGQSAFVAKLAPAGNNLAYSTRLGGSSGEEATDVAVDHAGNAYVVGWTSSTDFPTLNAIHGDRPGRDAFVVKLAPNGSRLRYATYLGGADFDYPYAVAVGPAGNAYVVGETTSLDFPTASPFQPTKHGTFQDGFVTQLSGFVKGDCNRDGRTDLLFHNTVTGQNDVWFMNGVTRVGPPATISPAAVSLDWLIVGTDDFDGDEQNDLVFRDRTTGATEVWLMNGPARIGAPVVLPGAPPPPWRVAATADFNRDGRPDLLWRNDSTQKIFIWTLNGLTPLGSLVPTPDQAVDANWDIAAALDYNGDGAPDFLWYNRTSGKLVLWFMDQNVQRITAAFTSPPNAGSANWKVLAGGDYGVGPAGLLGTMDVVWRNATSGKVVVWYMDDAGIRTSGTFTNPDAPSANPTDWIVAGPR